MLMFQYLLLSNVIFHFLIYLFAFPSILHSLLLYCIIIYFAISTHFVIYLKCFINSDSFVNTTQQHVEWIIAGFLPLLSIK